MQNVMTEIKRISPTYPIRPTQPSQKDREPGSKKRRKDSERKQEHDRDGDDHQIIDELV